MLNYDLALELTPYLVNEEDYVPWMSALNNLAYIATQFSTFDSDSENKGVTLNYTTYKVMFSCRLSQTCITAHGCE